PARTGPESQAARTGAPARRRTARGGKMTRRRGAPLSPTPITIALALAACAWCAARAAAAEPTPGQPGPPAAAPPAAPIDLTAKLFKIPTKFPADELYDYAYVMRYQVVGGAMDGQSILVAHYKPRLPRA